MSGSGDQKTAHVALLPSAGMGHLTPFIRLAALLTTQNVKVTFITPHPTASLVESQALSCLLASFPQITQKQFHLHLPSIDNDPIFSQFELIKNSSHHLLPPLLTSLSPPLSVLITDMTLASTVVPITQDISLPNFVLFTSSAKMLIFFLSYRAIADSIAIHDLDEEDVIELPGSNLMPRSWIPPPLLEKSDNLLRRDFIQGGRKTTESSGILVNTFECFEQESLGKLNSGEVMESLPSVFAIGPLPPCVCEMTQELAWLDGQPAGSVVYVSFGSRTGLSREQVREVGEGLVRSGSRFLWVVKEKKVDRKDYQGLEEVIGHELMERVKENGYVVKDWSKQEDILCHRAVGGFLSHCGWNSVIEAAWNGVRILGWPQNGDQKMNADLMEKIGLGTWLKNWGWGGEIVVNGAEIAERIREMMENESLRARAMSIREEARRAMGIGGSSNKALTELINLWRKL